jgi:hypothetical protein
MSQSPSGRTLGDWLAVILFQWQKPFGGIRLLKRCQSGEHAQVPCRLVSVVSLSEFPELEYGWAPLMSNCYHPQNQFEGSIGKGMASLRLGRSVRIWIP